MWGIDLRYIDEVSLARQIFLSMKQRILAGQLSQGEALPSTRELARGLSVSRNTVCEAYDMLLTEGFIVSRQGAPTRVAVGVSSCNEKSSASCGRFRLAYRSLLSGYGIRGTVYKQMQGGGIRISSVTRYCPMKDSHKDKLLLGYGHLSYVQKGIKTLHEVIAGKVQNIKIAKRRKQN